MIANHVHDALRQVRRLQQFIIERNMFKGYSGRARLIAGGATLGASIVLAGDLVPEDHRSHLLGWGAVLIFGLVVNYAALVYWFLFQDHE